MFDEDSADTGMGSDGNGIIYFAVNGNKHYLSDILYQANYINSYDAADQRLCMAVADDKLFVRVLNINTSKEIYGGYVQLTSV